MRARLFAAIPLAGPLRAALARAGRLVPGARPVPEANLHVTVRFFGTVEIEPVRDALAAALPPPGIPPELRVVGFARFARGVFAELDGDDRARSLLRALRRATEAVGVPPRARPFRPHVTVARFRRPPPAHALPIPAGTQPIDRLELLRSELRAEGARYETVAAFSLDSRKSASRSGPSRA